MLFCYLNQLFFFFPLLVLNEYRINSKRHSWCPCVKVDEQDQTPMLPEPQPENPHRRIRVNTIKYLYIAISSLRRKLCRGKLPQEKRDFEGPMDLYPKKIIKYIIGLMCCRVFIFLLAMTYFGFSVYGVVHLTKGLKLQLLASSDSYYRNYSAWTEDHFAIEIPLNLVVYDTNKFYLDSTQDSAENIIDRLYSDSIVPAVLTLSWLPDYRTSAYFTNTSESVFAAGLQSFLNYRPDLQNLVSFSSNETISAARYIILTSSNSKEPTYLSDMMQNARALTTGANVNCFIFHPAFIYAERDAEILPNTLQTLGITVAVMTLITIVFMPNIFVVILVVVAMVLILLGVIGFMYFLDLSLSFMTLIHLILSVGFSVDFCAHICHAFVTASGKDPLEKIQNAIERSGGPILNAALSTFVGLLMLLLSNSYIFLSFFKIMLLVILFGLGHAIFILPVLLVFLSCDNRKKNRVRSSR